MSGQTPDPRAWTGALADAAWGLLGAAAVLAFLAVWVVVPAPMSALLPFGVVAPELSPALSPVALAVAVGAWMVRVRRPARPAAVLALAAAMVLALPLLRLPAAARRFDAAMAAARFGGVAAHTRGDMRSSRFRLRDLLLGVDRGQSTVRRAVQMGTAGTDALVADVYARNGVRDAPLLVQIYGGAWQRGQPSDDEAFARYFAARGYVVAAIDYRHAPAARWPAQIDDVRAAITWLRAHAAAEFGADPTRLVLIGRSAGAQLALVAAYQDRAPAVAGVVSLYGPAFLADGWREPPRPDPLDVRAVLETYLGGTPDQVPDRYTAASPVTYVSPQAPPTLLVYGRRDHIVDLRFAQRLEGRLRQAGVPVALLEIPWAEHAFDLLPDGLSAQLALYYTERFIAQVTAAAPAAESVH